MRVLGERQDLGRVDPEHAGDAVGAGEAAVRDVEVPHAAVLRLDGVGDALEHVQVGDTIVFGKYAGQDFPIKIDGVDYVVLREDEVLAVLESK